MAVNPFCKLSNPAILLSGMGGGKCDFSAEDTFRIAPTAKNANAPINIMANTPIFVFRLDNIFFIISQPPVYGLPPLLLSVFVTQVFEKNVPLQIVGYFVGKAVEYWIYRGITAKIE